ncbi:MAG TPA: AI-2E family transporter [Herbaspirillum sp.]|jgi:predicted PurR-regulated permease PerM
MNAPDDAIPPAESSGRVPPASPAIAEVPPHSQPHSPSHSLPVPPAWPTRTQVDVRGILLLILTILAVLFALRSAMEFIIPLVVSIILAYALDPAVSYLQKHKVRRLAGATLVMLALVAALASGAMALRGQAVSIVNQLPEIATKISKTVGSIHDDDSMIDKLQRVATVIEKSSQEPNVRRIVVERPGNRVGDMLLAGSVGVMTFLGQTVMVLFLTFFLLLSGDTFRRKFIKLAGHTLSEKKISVHMLDEINKSIQRYMAMLLVTNAGLAIATWIAFRLIGLENAGTWAVAAGALHLIPYFGPLIVAVCTGVAAFLQFGTLGPALLTAAASLGVATLIGTLVTTWMTGRIARMNVVAVFISLLLFTWIWGVWGTLLSIPITVITKVVADHVEALEPLAEFLGE